jgi:hypothetical protein
MYSHARAKKHTYSSIQKIQYTLFGNAQVYPTKLSPIPTTTLYLPLYISEAIRPNNESHDLGGCIIKFKGLYLLIVSLPIPR